MERERHHPDAPEHDSGGPPNNHGIERVRAESESILDAADRMLDGIHVADAEGYLQDNRQHGGE